MSKVAFTGETTTGRLIMQYASENIVPVTLELGGESPNLFFADVMAEDDDFRQKALEGFGMFALNQGEVCTCPSRALIDAKIYGQFLELAIERAKNSRPGHPLDTATNVGAQASSDQLEKILSYVDLGKKEGAKVLLASARGSRASLPTATTCTRPSSRGTTRCACLSKKWKSSKIKKILILQVI